MKIKAIAACGNGMGSSQMIKMKINKTAADPADTSIASGMVPSLLTFQMWTASVSA